MTDSGATWRKSTYSGGSGGQCIEVGTSTRTVAVRDTVDREGFTLSVPAGAWANFISAVK